MRKYLARFALIGLAIPSFAKAQSLREVVSSFPAECQKTLQLFIEQNGGKVGQFDAQKISQDSKRIKWVPNSSAKLAGSGDNRLSAEHLIEEKQITFDPQNLQLNPQQTQFLLSFHECISASGIQDEQYQKSVSVFIKLLPKSILDNPKKFPNGVTDIADRQLNSIELRTKNPIYQREGGGTSVGGGGDGTAMNFKILAFMFEHPLYEKFKDLFKNQSLVLIDRVLTTSFELNNAPNVQMLTAEKKGSINVIRIPMQRWLNGYKETHGLSLSIDQWRMLLEALQILDLIDGDSQ